MMNNTEAKLRERIKELTCLYEVTSIIVNTNFDRMEDSFSAIAQCLQRAWQYASDAEVSIRCGEFEANTPAFREDLLMLSTDIRVFNEPEGEIRVGYPTQKYGHSDFLEEERDLLHSVSLALGSLMERKNIREQEALIRRQVERTDRLNILGEITAGIAHELNTPLANILGFAELIQERATDPKTIEDLDRIIENAIFSREVVKKLMFFACEIPQKVESIHLNTAIEEVVSLLTPNFRSKQLTYSSTLPDRDIQLHVDRIQITQVLFNLVMNAIYASPEKSRITIAVREKNNRVLISVSDEGNGIDPAISEKVFEPFFTTKPLGEGSGLGLSVVHGIVSSHGGSITHKPNRPKGTVFTVDFPKLD
ncbi:MULTISPECIES: sensor histidine kinase [unclassified Robiginitalea]|uniref:sensor histidine kinase n=1 Tax=Robiginitalea TaxID=252306 RepID=UPI00234A0E88|nr:MULTISPECIES: ATP-binding protein [unclassified Robiginitalea]MDC6355332.1 ATP-binding protein [Robiginitalea sp. PM2]MDC6375453.1 ATP-binding protein [Robiginitalea sp. SP8]